MKKEDQEAAFAFMEEKLAAAKTEIISGKGLLPRCWLFQKYPSQWGKPYGDVEIPYIARHFKEEGDRALLVPMVQRAYLACKELSVLPELVAVLLISDGWYTRNLTESEHISDQEFYNTPLPSKSPNRQECVVTYLHGKDQRFLWFDIYDREDDRIHFDSIREGGKHRDDPRQVFNDLFPKML